MLVFPHHLDGQFVQKRHIDQNVHLHFSQIQGLHLNLSYHEFHLVKYPLRAQFAYEMDHKSYV